MLKSPPANASAVKKSDWNYNAQWAALTQLKEIIRNSIEVEVHPDYNKQGGGRSAESDFNEKVLVHRFYGAAKICGKTYRVKTTIKEFRPTDDSSKKKQTPKAYAYEVAEIELLSGGQFEERQNLADPSLKSDKEFGSSISVAKLLQGVEKSYEKGKKSA